MTIQIVDLDEAAESDWDEYVLVHPLSTFYHQTGWKRVVQKTYGHKPIYLVAVEDGDLKGILPLFSLRSILFGNKIVSLPFCPYGGVCADNEQIGTQLVEKAILLAKEEGSDYLELKNLYSSPASSNGTSLSNLYNTLILGLDDDPDAIWSSFTNKVRNSIRKPLKAGLLVERCDNLKEFYHIYGRNMRRLGSPSHSIGFFENLFREFGTDAEALKVTVDGVPIAAVVLLYYKDTVISGWAASDHNHIKLNPNDLLYWSAIKDSCERKYRYFDFGRSLEDSGTFNFKKHWGADVKPLYYYYYLNNVDHIPNSSTLNPRRQKISKIWRRLPIELTGSLSPILRRNFP